MDKTDYILLLYKMELQHQHLYEVLAKREKNRSLKPLLKKIAGMERRHRSLWAEIIRLCNGEVPEYNVNTYVSFIMLFRRIFGLALTINMIEYFENRLEAKFERFVKTHKLSKRETTIVNRIRNDEEEHERALEDKIIGYGRIITNIRDIAFGMNDGLVELLAVIVGLAAAVTNPLFVVLGGFIVSISGTLSMAGGAYLSTEYEESLRADRKDNEKSAALRSGFYVGVMYFIGTLFPLWPFLAGFAGVSGIAIAIISTAIILTVTSTLISIVGRSSILGRVSKTLLISLGIAAITIVIGYYARSVLNIPI
ncbi:MAG: VIT1/CCC1 transporter family protein [Candidatus Marsarchaeota archaeon]|nr:VIT1/CCC1 transporter family protein [Candidatus Marsarchaeota archaeon]